MSRSLSEKEPVSQSIIAMGQMNGDKTSSLPPACCHADVWRSLMREPLRNTSRPWEPQHYRQEAHSPATQLPEGDVVFFLLDTVPKLDV